MTEEEMARESYLKEDSEYLSMLDEGELYNTGYLAGLHEGQSQLAEAKKIIEELYENMYNIYENSVLDTERAVKIMRQAEQFLGVKL